MDHQLFVQLSCFQLRLFVYESFAPLWQHWQLVEDPCLQFFKICNLQVWDPPNGGARSLCHRFRTGATCERPPLCRLEALHFIRNIKQRWQLLQPSMTLSLRRIPAPMHV